MEEQGEEEGEQGEQSISGGSKIVFKTCLKVRVRGRKVEEQDFMSVLDKGCGPKVLVINFRLDFLSSEKLS